MPFTDYIVPQNTGNVNPLGFIFLAFAHTERQRRFEKYAECQQLHRLQRQRLQIQRGRKELLAVPHPCGLRMQCRTVHLLRQFRKETLIGKKQKKRKERAAEIFCRPLSYDRSLHQKCLNNIKVGDASHTPFQEEKVMLFFDAIRPYRARTMPAITACKALLGRRSSSASCCKTDWQRTTSSC